MGKRITIASAIALVVTGLTTLFRETLIWALGKLLDQIPHPSASRIEAIIQAVPWTNVLGLLIIAVGVILGVRGSRMTAKSAPNGFAAMGARAGAIASFITNYRDTGRLWRERLPQIVPTVLDGNSLLLSFEKAGFEIPSFYTNEAERLAIGMQRYFSLMYPLIRDGHIDVAKASAEQIAKAAERAAVDFKPIEWWTSDSL